MRHPFCATLAVTCFVLSIANHEAYAESTPRGQVAEALAAMHRWVGDGDNGQRWRRYLQSAALEAELAKGDAADPAVVATVRDQYGSGAPGLDKDQFVRVREALDRWHDELTLPSVDALPQLADVEQHPLTAPEPSQTDAARRRLATAAAGLDRFLTPGGIAGARWKEFLHFDQLRSILAADEHPDPAVLREMARRYDRAYPGLELPPFENVQTALEDYARLLGAQQDDTQEHYDRQMQTLAAVLEAYQEEPTPERVNLIGNILGWLEDRNQAPRLVRAIRGNFRRPNLLIHVSEELAAAGIEEGVNEMTPVRDVILGTHICGEGHTVGTITADLVPSGRAAVLDVLFQGSVDSKTVGVNGPATIWSIGLTRMGGRKRLLFDEEGIRALDARAAAKLRSKTTGVKTRFHGLKGRLADKIAWRRVLESQPQAERIGAHRAEGRLNARLDKQVNEFVTDGNEAYWQRFRRPLVRRGQFPRLDIRTTDQSLLVTALQAGRAQLGAPTEPPVLDAEGDLAVRVHETALNNLLAGMLAGERLEEEQMRERLTELFGELPERFQPVDDREPWSITFAADNPVTVRFRDGHAHLMIRGAAYTSGDRQYSGMNVAATYRLQVEDGRLKGIRIGELEIFPPGFVPGRRRLSVREQTLRSLLQRRFGRMLSEEIASEEPLQLPGRWSKAGVLSVASMSSQDGWLGLAWEAEPQAPVAQVPDEPQQVANVQ